VPRAELRVLREGAAAQEQEAGAFGGIESMSDLSKKMRNSRQRATQGEWYYIEMNDGDSLSSVGIECDSLDILELQSIPEYGGIDPCTTICLTLLQSPRAVQHRSGKAYFNAEFIADAANETDNLCAEIEALEAKLNDSEDQDDAAWQTQEALDEKRQALIAATQSWDRDLIAHAGVVGSINHEGRLSFTFGIVAKADQAKLKRVLAARAPEGAATSEDTPTEAAIDQSGPKLPKVVARELTAARAAASASSLRPRKSKARARS